MYVMAKLNNKIIISAILIIILLLTLITGCSEILGKSKQNQTKQNQGQKKSPPKTLTSLENTTESMYKDIQEVIDKRSEQQQEKQQPKEQQVEQLSNQQQQQNSEGQQKQNDASNEKNSQGSEQKNRQDSQEKKQEQKQDKKQDKSTNIDWNSMKKNVEKLQNSWSNYASVAMKDGASNEIIREYENQLDLLTTKVMERQEESLINAVNDLYKYYPKFLDLYKHQAPPNIKEMKYYIRKIIIESQSSQWFESNQALDAIKQVWETAKARMEKPDQDMNQKVQTALDSFSRSVQQQNKHLIKLKGEILINILEEIK